MYFPKTIYYLEFPFTCSVLVTEHIGSFFATQKQRYIAILIHYFQTKHSAIVGLYFPLNFFGLQSFQYYQTVNLQEGKMKHFLYITFSNVY